MKVKLNSSSKLCLVKAVKEMLNIGLKEAKDLVDEQEKVFGCPPNAKRCVIVDSEETEERIKAIARECDTTYTLVDVCEPQVQAEKKLQEVTDDDLGVSICSVGKEYIAWKCKLLFTHEQATKVIAGLFDAKLKVAETHVMYEDIKATMLTITKAFPSGTRKTDLDEFEHLIRDFVQAMCVTISLEDKLEEAKEDGIEAFKKLQNI